jgi:hypothetical protein
MLVVGAVGVVFGALVMMSSGLVGGVVSYDATTAPQPTTFYEVEVKGIPFVNTDFTGVTALRRIDRNDELIEFAPMMFERVFNGHDELNEWRDRVESGAPLDLHDVVVTQYDVDYKPMRVVRLKGAWPSSWRTPPMDANSENAMIERFTLSFDEASVKKRKGNPKGGADGRKRRK